MEWVLVGPYGNYLCWGTCFEDYRQIALCGLAKILQNLKNVKATQEAKPEEFNIHVYREYFNVPKGPTKCIWFGGNWFDANWQITALWNNWNTTRALTCQKPIVHCTSNHNYKLNCGYWFTNFSRIHPTSCKGCYAGKSIKIVVWCLNFLVEKPPAFNRFIHRSAVSLIGVQRLKWNEV